VAKLVAGRFKLGENEIILELKSFQALKRIFGAHLLTE